ncbi:hypothetical protein NHL51_02535 [Leucobacter sp. gxy201]|uniref:hypothetical protein n=1 Tax=Leucobacter sp. gxy201 TaxID=2957200 RepID=UPI003DA145CB
MGRPLVGFVERAGFVEPAGFVGMHVLAHPLLQAFGRGGIRWNIGAVRRIPGHRAGCRDGIPDRNVELP